jgi:hypothetical protein
MAITVKHKFVSAIPDAGDTTIVQPSNWNDDHQLTGTIPVDNGGTGASTLTGYVKGNGTSAMTAATTIPSTDVTGLGTMSTQNANNVTITGGSISGTTVSGYIPTTEKAVANGVATLDGSGTVPISQLPAAVLGALSYQGTWNASTNTPTLTSSVGTKGYYYVVNVAGSTNLNGVTDWQVGDWAVYNGTAWQKVDNTDAVTSVNGKTGTVVLGYGDITTGVVQVTNGGTGVTTSSGANSVVLRDANGNITTNCLFEGFSTQAASVTTIVLTASSVQNWQITGSGGQTIKLPDATTLPNGATFTFNNNQSSGTIIVQNNSSTTVATINSGGYVTVVLLSNSTAAGSWDRHDSTPSNVSWSTNTLDYAGSITSATWNGNTVAVNRGGTGAATLTGYVKGSGTTALTATSTIPTTDLSGTISNAQLANSAITINGTSTSLGGSVSVGTVTSVAATAGTGISVTGSPITSSGTLNITNTAPDQTVVLTAGTGISTTGTYPNFTITNTSPSSGGTVTSITAGTGLSGGTITSSGTIAIDSTVATLTGAQTLTNKTISGASNTLSNIGNSSLTNSAITINGTSTSLGGSISVGTVTSVTGTSPVVSSGGNTPAISIPAATGSVNGYLTSTDWTTFNNKQPAGSYLTAVTADAPLSGSGTSGSHLVIATANTTTTGAISSTDWNTFNGKQAALVSGTNIKTVNGTTLLGSGDLGTITYAYGGTGQTTVTTGDLLYGSATNVWSKLGIGSTGQILRVVSGAPAWGTDYTGTVTSVSGTGTVSGISLSGTVTSSGNLTLGGTLDLSSPPAIGGTAANTITGTTITATKFVGVSGGTF